jgi:hypothetical protein
VEMEAVVVHKRRVEGGKGKLEETSHPGSP